MSPPGAQQVRGRVALVAGLGVSGAAAATALAEAGAVVRAVDRDRGAALRERAATLGGPSVDVRLGADLTDPTLLDGVDLVVPSPGIPDRHPLPAEALRRGLPVWSEPELAWRLSAGRTRLVAVTGTNGKTTTTDLIATLLGVPAGGNIGTPLSTLLTAAAPATAVVELSSFQLRFTETLRPVVAVLLNVAPDHLDWHGSAAAYEEAKARIWAACGPEDRVVLGADDGARRVAAAFPPGAPVVHVRTEAPGDGEVGIEDGWVVVAGDDRRRVARVADLALRGRHNLANACAAVAAAVAAGADPGGFAGPLARFEAGPHRLALVAERDGVRWVDDSKATNPHAAAAALEACGDPHHGVVWIAGGRGKGLDFDQLAPALRAHVRHALTIGESGPAIATLTRACGVPTTEAGQLRAAVVAAARIARRGDTVLLAPACASQDQFLDYRDRGRAFAAMVAEEGAVSMTRETGPGRGAPEAAT